MIDESKVTTEKFVGIYKATNAIFLGLLKEIRELSKKKPDAIMSAGKVNLINKVLDDLKLILENEPEGKFLDILDDQNLPQTSDAVLMMCQYETALKSFRSKYYQTYKIDSHEKHAWVTADFLKEFKSSK